MQNALANHGAVQICCCQPVSIAKVLLQINEHCKVIAGQSAPHKRCADPVTHANMLLQISADMLLLTIYQCRSHAADQSAVSKSLFRSCNGASALLQIRCGDLYNDTAIQTFTACVVSDNKCVPQKIDKDAFPLQ